MNADMQSDRRKCIDRLAYHLAELGIAFCNTEGTVSRDSPRGELLFMQFLPRETTLFRIADFPRYFHSGLRHDLLSARDARRIAHQQVLTGAVLRKKYEKLNGRFLKNLQTGKIGEFLDSASDPMALKRTEERETWFPDILPEQFGWPCVIDEHMSVKGFKELRLDYQSILEIAQHPMRALTAAMEIVRIGPWLGVSPDDIITCLKLLEGSEPPLMREKTTTVYAEGIIIPFFAGGFQGAIFGSFRGLKDEQREPLWELLKQAGQFFADQCALSRRTLLSKFIADEGLNAKTLAESIVNIASPIEYVIVSSSERKYALILQNEVNYLAGYNIVKDENVDNIINSDNSELLNGHALDMHFSISLKTLDGHFAIDPVFYELRIKNAIREFLLHVSQPSHLTFSERTEDEIEYLDINDLNRNIFALQHQLNVSRGANIAAKLLCFFEMVRDKLAVGELRLLNNEMKRSMTKRLTRVTRTGYHVSGKALKGFENSVNNILPRKFRFEPLNQNVIRVSWKALL